MYSQIVAAVFMAGVLSLLFVSGFMWQKIWDTVDRNSEEAEKEGPYFFTPAKYDRIKKKYKKFAPNSRLLLALRIVEVAAGVLFLAAAFILL